MAKSESDLLRLLHSTESTFVERKTSGDHKDWVKTVVAFANTLRPDQEGVLFIGATDRGEIEASPVNLDKLQKTFSEKMQAVYPDIYFTTNSVQENGRECLAVSVPGSSARPHFAGPLYVRDGSQTVRANSDKYETLLASRISKVYELQQWIGKLITIRTITRRAGVAYSIDENLEEARVIAANQFYLTVSFRNLTWSYPLNRLEISYNHVADRLEIELLQPQM